MKKNTSDRLNKYRRYIIPVVAASAVAVVAFWITAVLSGGARGALSRVPVVTYGSRGYTPAQITVHTGDTVTFKNTSKVAFWPASNPHPVHNIYSSFDPKKPVPPGGSWTFQFTQPGRFTYHDHIQPSNTGIVIVLPPGISKAEPLACDNLRALSHTEKVQCWEELLDARIKKGDITGALKLFAQFYRSDTQFSIGCHYRAHLVGDAYYTYIAKRLGKDRLELPPETAYCGYGFYHGLFEHMIRDQGERFSAAGVYELCDSLDRKFGTAIPLLRINCFHGAGHGIMPDPPDERLWGNAQAIMTKPLSLCDSISKDTGEIQQCYEGVYNVIVDWMWRGQYGFSPDTDTPFALCDAQKPQHQKACYYEFVMRLGELEGGDLVRLVGRYIDPIQSTGIAQLVTTSLVAAKMSESVVEQSQLSYLTACRSLAERLRESCLSGVIFGFRAHGDPGVEYKKALVFCASRLLTQEEKAVCYRELVKNNRYIYTESKVRAICRQFESGFQQYCDEKTF